MNFNSVFPKKILSLRDFCLNITGMHTQNQDGFLKDQGILEKHPMSHEIL